MNPSLINSAAKALFEIVQSFHVRIDEEGRVEFNGYKSWEMFHKKVDLLYKNFENEVMDNLLLMEESQNRRLYIDRLYNRFKLARNELYELFNIFSGVRENTEGIEFKGLEVGFVKELIFYAIPQSSLNLPDGKEFISADESIQVASYITSIRDVAMHFSFEINKYLGEDAGFDKEKSMSPNTATSKQQLLILYFLEKNSYFNFRSIHDDMPQQSNFLIYLLNRNYENTYKYLRQLRGKNFKKNYLTKENLLLVKEAFKYTKFEGIKLEIEDNLAQFD